MELSLTKLKMKLLCNTDYTFFTTLLFSLEVREENSIPTACTNGRSILINKQFWNDLSESERIFLLIHEVMHVALNHITRRGDREARRFNHACDYAINYDLVQSGYTMIEGGLYDEQYKDLTAEQIYDLLPEDGEYDENDIEFSDDPELSEELDRLLMGAGAAAKLAGKEAGCIPACGERRLDELRNPKLNWRIIFQNRMLSHSTDDYSMQFPDEEYMPDLYAPTLYSEGMGELNCYVDVSGSVSQNDLDVILTEVNNLSETLKPTKLALVSFDTKIHFRKEYDRGDLVDMGGIDMQGGGGTSVKEVYKDIEETKPEIALVITDGYYCERPLKSPADVIYLILDNEYFETPNGEVIHVNTGDY